MKNTADLAMIQKTNIDALHKEGKSQRVITEMCGCLQSAVSKHIKCKVDWNLNRNLVNCWPSRKYVHLLYMYSILGRGSFCLITASIRRGIEVISLWHC